MKSINEDALHTAAVKIERGGRSQAVSRNHNKDNEPWQKIDEFIDKQFHNGIYHDTLEQAVANLYKAGVKSASLFDAKTGAVTKKGVETITAAVEEGWHKWLDLGRDGFYEAVELLPSLLSDRAVLDFLMAQAAQRDDLKKPQAERQPAAVTTVS